MVKMITAEEAREIAWNKNRSINLEIDRISSAIRECAEKGWTSYYFTSAEELPAEVIKTIMENGYRIDEKENPFGNIMFWSHRICWDGEEVGKALKENGLSEAVDSDGGKRE